MGFEVGDAFVGEPVAGAGDRALLLRPPLGLSQFADRAVEDAVLRGDPLGRVFGVVGFEIADLAEEQTDAFALGVDLAVSSLERVLGVQDTSCQDASI